MLRKSREEPTLNPSNNGRIFFVKEYVMKTITKHRVEAITGDTPQEAAALFNEAMDRLAELHPTFEREGCTFWIHYKVIHQEAETLAEANELAGNTAHCMECPFIIRDLNRFGNIDARKKWATCGKTGERTNIECRACDIYYENFGERSKEH